MKSKLDDGFYTLTWEQGRIQPSSAWAYDSWKCRDPNGLSLFSRTRGVCQKRAAENSNESSSKLVTAFIYEVDLFLLPYETRFDFVAEVTHKRNQCILCRVQSARATERGDEEEEEEGGKTSGGEWSKRRADGRRLQGLLVRD